MNKLFLIALVFSVLSTSAFAKCVVGGCSGELCVSEGSDMSTPCWFKEEFGCYQIYGECEQQQSGQCGWKQTTTLQSCLKDPSVAMKELEKRSKLQQEQYRQQHKGNVCVKTGSYRQVCIDELDMGVGKLTAEFDATPNLAFHDSFSCYDQHAECKKNLQGVCGWVDTGKLKNCLADPKSFLKPPAIYQY